VTDSTSTPNPQLEREQREPLAEGAGKTPVWFFGFVAAMVGWGAYYLLTSVPGVTLAGDLRSAQIPTGPPTGDAIYAVRCVACHQANGQGIAGVFPPLANSEWVTEDPETPIRILLLGIQGEIEVLGNVYNNVMPAFATLSDEEIALVLSYVRAEWGNDAPAIEPNQVAEIRAGLGARTDPWKGGAELAALRPASDGAGDDDAGGDAPADDTGAEPAATADAAAGAEGAPAGDAAATPAADGDGAAAAAP
jgi:mono/diheme cytochrome c family protein